MPNDDRRARVEARRKKIADVRPKLERVRVLPANDDVRRDIKHPSGRKFPASGSVEWPFDQFTKRRLHDGSVTREDDSKREEAKREEARKREEAAKEAPHDARRPRTPAPAHE